MTIYNIMKTKEELLKIYSAYLPYEFQIIGIHSEQLGDDSSQLTKVEKQHLLTGLSNGYAIFDNSIYGNPIELIKPILYSMDMLTKEIEHKSERFIPLHKILEEYCFDLSKMDDEEILSYAESLIEIDMTVTTYNLLLEWHFDIFGMIDENLAIRKDGVVENWRDVEGYEGYYQVSDLGRIKSLSRSVKSTSVKSGFRKLKSKVFKNGNTNDSLVVSLSKDGITKGYLIYRLVAKEFIPNPENKPEVNHLDGNRLNNHVSNLEWSTRSENEQHAYDTGLYISRKGVDHHMSKVSECDIEKMKNQLSLGITRNQIAQDFNLSYSQTCRILKGTSWKHLDESEYIKKESLK